MQETPMTSAAALASLIERYADGDGVHATPIPRLNLIRMSQPTVPLHTLHEPALCILAQGAKQVLLGDKLFAYDPANYLVVSVDVPIVGQVTKASAEAPYLCLRLDLDPAAVGALALEIGARPDPSPPAGGLALSTATPALLDAAVRLVALLEAPRDAAVLAPLIEREILYRALTGDQGARLAEIGHGDSRLAQVNRAIGWIKANYARPFSIERLADEARMSASALHHHFKAVTALSPLQYQKQLRLQEARRLIFAGGHDAASAGHTVGYDSPSQFSREYARLFGAPPRRDATRLRAAGDLMMVA
jgi:AraC-like DNA-binding protein